MSIPLIQLKNLCKSFGPRKVLDGVTLDIQSNAITAIIGKSGVGKSVLVKIIMGLLDADDGQIIFDGMKYSEITRKEFSKIKDRCGYMFQHNALFDSLTIFENIALPLREKYSLKESEIREKVAFRIDQLDLGEVADMYPNQVSGGMQKRVALARVLIAEPEIIFFDEPTTGLDPIRKNSVFSMIHHYRERLNFTAVIITHDVPDIFYIAHQVHILDEGKIIFSGAPVELEQSHLQALYLYTHGHDMLVDEVTGLRNRLALIEHYAGLQKSFPSEDQERIVVIRLAGLQNAIDFQGNLFVYARIQEIARILQRLNQDFIVYGGFFKGVFVIFAQPEDQAVQTVLTDLTAFFGQGESLSLMRSAHLRLEVGSTPLHINEDLYFLVQKALSKTKSLVEL